MSGPEDFLPGADGPRPLPDDFRARLEEALIAGDEPVLHGLDGPRPMPAPTRARIEEALLAQPARRRMRRELVPLGAVAAVIVLLLGAVAVLAPGGGGKQPNPPAALGPGDIGGAQLIAFNSCDELLDYLKTNALERVTAWGLNGPFRGVFMAGDVGFTERMAIPNSTAAGGGGVGTDQASSTNVQEVGVDEPDTVKNDGVHLYVVAGGALHVVDATSNTVIATVPLANGGGNLLLEGDRLLVLGSASITYPTEGPLRDLNNLAGSLTSFPFPDQQVVVTTYDVSNPANPTVVSSKTLDGWLVSARLSGGLARIVVGSSPLKLPFVYPVNPDLDSEAAALAQNKAVIESSTIDQWIGDRNCTEITHPATFSGFDLLSVYTVDPGDPAEVPSTGLLAGGDTVYASGSALYVATQNWDTWSPFVLEDTSEPPTPPEVTTQIHKFDISGDGPASYMGSGEVSGYLLNQWAMSEYEGNLRVATTNQPPRGGGPAQSSSSSITILGPHDGELVAIGSVGGLGPDQQIQGVRFIDYVGYVVTFRRTDPLYTIDLRDPEHPAVRGALEVTGYSAYLHPIGDGLLLGIGQEATEEGRTTGLQVSVFDVRDLDNPALASRTSFEGTYSEAEQNHHAFLWWAARNLAVVPTYGIYESGTGTSSALLIEATASSVSQVGEVSHEDHASPGNPWSAQISRSVVIGDVLYTVSDIGVLGTNLDTLTETGWAQF